MVKIVVRAVVFDAEELDDYRPVVEGEAPEAYSIYVEPFSGESRRLAHSTTNPNVVEAIEAFVDVFNEIFPGFALEFDGPE